MERIKSLLARFSQTAALFFTGFVLIVYLALGILYWQQAPQQRDLEDQITKLNAVLRVPLPSAEQLQAEYTAVNQKLAPIGDNVTIAMLVSLAQESGIDVSEAGAKFHVPVAGHSGTGVGGSSYQLVTFSGIQVQGDGDKVLAFISTLDSDKPLKTSESPSPRIVNRVVTGIVTDYVEVTVPTDSADGERRAEWRSIIETVATMMKDNGLYRIPNPVSKATNLMGDDPTTLLVFEGFPDKTTTAADKGYTGNATPKRGYLLYQHDRINTDNTTLYTTTNYTQTLTTVYYYTSEADGTVHQWNGAGMVTEYKDSSPTKIELKASLNVNIYFRAK